MRGQYCSTDLVRLGEGGDDHCAGDGATLLVHLLPGGGHWHLTQQTHSGLVLMLSLKISADLRPPPGDGRGRVSPLAGAVQLQVPAHSDRLGAVLHCGSSSDFAYTSR